MNRTQIALAKTAQNLVRSRKECASLKAQLSKAAIQLEQARGARFAPITEAKPRASRNGDCIRMICCDVHGAKMNRAAVAAFLADVRRMQPDEVMLLGDIVDCGGFLAAHHTWGYVAETSYTYEEDIRAARTFIDQLRAAAPNAKILFVEGNHELRVERWCITQVLKNGNPADAEGLRRRNAPEFLLELSAKEIPYYRMGVFYDELPVPGTIKRGNCYFTHGSFVTAKHATAKIQSKLAGNVVFGNTHREQAERVRRVNTGIIGAWNPGCLCELQPLWNHTDPTDWTHGYAIQFVSKSGKFLHLNVPILDGGESLILAMMSTLPAKQPDRKPAR